MPAKPEKNSAQNMGRMGESTNRKSTKSTRVAMAEEVANFATDIVNFLKAD
jgi:hypothetical protein